MGRLRQAQGRLAEAVGWYASALPFAVEHQMPAVAHIILDLTPILGEMGETAFVQAWRSALPGEDELLNRLFPQALAAVQQQDDEN